MRNIPVWKEVKEALFTPGGDPVYECPVCGWRHVHGIESPKAYSECPNCKAHVQYPWEVVKNLSN